MSVGMLDVLPPLILCCPANPDPTATGGEASSGDAEVDPGRLTDGRPWGVCGCTAIGLA